MHDAVVRTERLSKHYGGLSAVVDLSLRVLAGEIYGFLGPNGAGKTTTILMLLGIITPTAGTVYLWGRPMSADALAVKRRIGVVGEQDYLHDHLSAEEYLRFFAELYGVPRAQARIDALLARLSLDQFRSLRAHDFSRGMKQKLSLARALLHEPELLILDEPVSGLDPHGIVEVRQLLLELNRQGTTILISSHLLSEVERTAHRVGILHRGRLVREDTLAGLRALLAHDAVVEVQLQYTVPGLVETLRGLPFVRRIDGASTRLTVTVAEDGAARGALSQAITASGGIVIGMRTAEPTLEDAFLTLTDNAVEQWTTTR